LHTQRPDQLYINSPSPPPPKKSVQNTVHVEISRAEKHQILEFLEPKSRPFQCNIFTHDLITQMLLVAADLTIPGKVLKLVNIISYRLTKITLLLPVSSYTW